MIRVGDSEAEETAETDSFTARVPQSVRNGDHSTADDGQVEQVGDDLLPEGRRLEVGSLSFSLGIGLSNGRYGMYLLAVKRSLRSIN